jgi:hypothetical protein
MDRKERQIHIGVGYSVSRLHRVTYLDTSAMTARPPVKSSDSMLESVAELVGAKVGEGNTRFYSPTVEEILAWRIK